MSGSHRGSRAADRTALRWLAGALAGCPGLEDGSARSDGGRPDAQRSRPESPEPSRGNAEDPRRDLVSARDRIGLGCALFPGCGGGLAALTSFALALVLVTGQGEFGTDVSAEPAEPPGLVELPEELVEGMTPTNIAVGDAGLIVVGREDAAHSPHSSCGLAQASDRSGVTGVGTQGGSAVVYAPDCGSMSAPRSEATRCSGTVVAKPYGGISTAMTAAEAA